MLQNEPDVLSAKYNSFSWEVSTYMCLRGLVKLIPTLMSKHPTAPNGACSTISDDKVMVFRPRAVYAFYELRICLNGVVKLGTLKV